VRDDERDRGANGDEAGGWIVGSTFASAGEEFRAEVDAASAELETVARGGARRDGGVSKGSGGDAATRGHRGTASGRAGGFCGESAAHARVAREKVRRTEVEANGLETRR